MTDQSVQTLKGVGASTTARLDRLGIHTIGELLEHFPLRYEDRTQRKNIIELQHGEFTTFTATIVRGELHQVKGKSIARVSVRDNTGQALLVWFNQPYRATAWKPATEVTVYGRVNRFLDTVQIEAPEVETATQAESLNTARIVPVYPLTQGLGARALRKLMAAALSAQQFLPETIP
ncbi:MAG: recG, partial [Firmicutes bacterium]|nr:recG [Bacillota bacterium]